MGQVSLLLLWSIFLCAASFMEDGAFAESFCESQAEFKRIAYQRAKTLYDMDYERDKVTLIQSVFLMGHWYANAEDRTGPWHWNGIAISLSHTIGLHMLTSSAREGVRPLWRRLWWCIYYREVWASLGQGRPMRISLDHCSTPMPESYDTAVVRSHHQDYLPEHLETLLGLWLSLIKLTCVLGRILSTNYRMNGINASKADLERDESEIRATWLSIECYNQSRVVASHLYQFKLHFQSAIIALYRPFVNDLPIDVPSDEMVSWQKLASRKLRAAASDATSAITSMMAGDMMKYCQTMVVITLIPPMQVHLLGSRSSNPMSCQLAKHSLALCLLALNELRGTYVSADAAYKLFERAQTMIKNTLPDSCSEPVERTESVDAPELENVQWLDGFGNNDPTSMGLFSTFWAPFGITSPGDSFESFQQTQYANGAPVG